MNVTLPPIEGNLTGPEIITIVIASIAGLPLLILLVWNCIKCCRQDQDSRILMDYADVESSFEVIGREVKKERHGLTKLK
jgi:hypothetical protein